jgi:acetyl-CoA carboxylase biotin carboxyl carrier protein
MDVKAIKEIIRFIEKTSLTEFEYESETERIYVNRASLTSDASGQTYTQQPVQQAPKPEPISEKPVEKKEDKLEGVEIKAPIVGTFYEAPSPGAEPFVKEGDVVKKGQTLCIIEAMKIMNEIEAEYDCRILKVLGVNGEPVEYGETIFLVEPR